MNKLSKYKDYSPNEIGKLNENVDLNITYEVRGNDAGEEWFPPEDDNDANYNPFDLNEVVKLLIEKEKLYGEYELYIVKVTTDILPDEEIERMKMQITGDKYNI